MGLGLWPVLGGLGELSGWLNNGSPIVLCHISLEQEERRGRGPLMGRRESGEIWKEVYVFPELY